MEISKIVETLEDIREELIKKVKSYKEKEDEVDDNVIGTYTEEETRKSVYYYYARKACEKSVEYLTITLSELVDIEGEEYDK